MTNKYICYYGCSETFPKCDFYSLGDIPETYILHDLLIKNPSSIPEDVYLGQYDLKEDGTWVRLLKDCKTHKDAYLRTEQISSELFYLEDKVVNIPEGLFEIVLKITYGEV
ncbi:hypothetical protein N9C10_03495 [Flavobacteriaceae bacterium]|nr:hypothetical protein [Flavobacteriaceae bacterium]